MSEGTLGLGQGKPEPPGGPDGADVEDSSHAGKPRFPSSQGGGRRPREDEEEGGEGPPCKRRRKTVGFDSVTVYYFQRMQGFTCVPSQGGSTLGMSPMHTEKKTFSLKQYTSERRRLHFDDLDCATTSSSSCSSPPGEVVASTSCEGHHPPFQNHHPCLQNNNSHHHHHHHHYHHHHHHHHHHHDHNDATASNHGGGHGDGMNGDQEQANNEGEEEEEEDEEEEEEEEEVDTLNYLQPVPTRKRRALLRASGVRRIDALEKDECRDIRASREFCGCTCKGRCLPDSCSCSLAGIACQVDRMSFPCGCTQEGCANASGRTEFNPVRVRAHFLHTLMRLEIEKQQQQGLDRPDLALAGLASQAGPGFHCLDPRRLLYYNGGALPPGIASACQYSSEEDDEEDEEEEEDTSCSENSDYSTTEEEEGEPAARNGRPPPHRDYTDLSCAVSKGSAGTALATRGVVPVDPVFVGCGDCATDGLIAAANQGDSGNAASEENGAEEEEGSSSTATTDSAFGEIIKASLGEVATL
ncbi:cysteine/serine-rich nuclear protein 3 [Ixodes scapularis]|nr:cysteine/serine-rich nuclear protein 3 [Ixodes scapularis]XP_029835514.2 cysteine/serine-rich nuclear protein 3 [Ixodes scapularis]